MKRIVGILLVVLLQSSAYAESDKSLELAKSIVTGGELVNIEQNIKSMTDMVIGRQPALSKHRVIIQKHFTKALTSEQYKTDMAKVIASFFSTSELQELKKLMEYPVMKKWLKGMPEIMPKLAKTNTDHIYPVMQQMFAEIESIDPEFK